PSPAACVTSVNFQSPSFRYRAFRGGGVLVGEPGRRAPFRKRMSILPSPLKSKVAKPELTVSTMYLRPELPSVWTKVMPVWRVRSSSWMGLFDSAAVSGQVKNNAGRIHPVKVLHGLTATCVPL